MGKMQGIKVRKKENLSAEFFKAERAEGVEKIFSQALGFGMD